MFSVEFRADYIDTDAMGVIHHASYLRYFEKARVEWMRAMGHPYRKIEGEGYMLPLKDCRMKYFKPLYFDDLVEVVVSLGEMGHATVELEYEVKSGGELKASGATHHVLCKAKELENGERKFVPVRIPKEWRTLWQQQNAKKS